MKALAVLRVSTEGQQIEDQREELFAYIKSLGYDEIVPVEAIGASAIKLDEKYMDMAEKIKNTILEGGIDAVCVWEISRLGRNEIILMDFKEFFIKHKVQFICKNPSLKLLNEDGSVNTGTELAFSLFATMSKQEMLEKKSRFARAKTAMMKKGQSVGGNTRKFGYKIDENKFFVEDEEESKVVKAIFDLYSTGQYSVYTLSKELQERGMDASANLVAKTINCSAYVGEEVGNFGLHYPPIISRELFDKCTEIRTANKIEMKRGERIVLGSKLVKCPECGATCTSNSRHYVCSRHYHHGPCNNGFALRQCVVDDLLWRVASVEHLQYLIDMNENKAEQYRKELDVVDEKISAAEEKMNDFAKKKQRIADNYEDGLIGKKERDAKLSKVNNESISHRNYLTSLQEKRRAISALLDNDNPDYARSFEAALDSFDVADKYDVVHKHILSLTAKQESFGKRDPRTTRPNGVRIEITTIRGWKETYMYVPKFLNETNLFKLVNGRWHKDYVEIKDKKKGKD